MKKSSIYSILMSGTILTCAIAHSDSNTVPPPATAPDSTTTVSTQPPKNNPNVVYVYTTQPPPSGATVLTQAPTETSSAASTQVPAKKDYSFDGNPALCFGRGIANIATCWLEIPRCIIYDNEEIPVIGTIVGIPEGAGYTVVRALAGTADIVSFGLDMGTFYGKYLPNFVWDANWNPPKK